MEVRSRGVAGPTLQTSPPLKGGPGTLFSLLSVLGPWLRGARPVKDSAFESRACAADFTTTIDTTKISNKHGLITPCTSNANGHGLITPCESRFRGKRARLDYPVRLSKDNRATECGQPGWLPAVPRKQLDCPRYYK